MTEQPQPTAQQYKELADRLEDIQKTIDEANENFDTKLSEFEKALAVLLKAVTDVPNRTDTVLEKNQHIIFNAVVQTRDAALTSNKQLEALGAKLREIDNAEPT